MDILKMQDVANRCSVSVATVSRVINGKSNVSPKTRERVLKVIQELNYHPNMLGRNLRQSRTKLIVIIIPFVENQFCGKIINGAMDVVKRKGYSLIIAQSYNDPKIAMEYFSLLDDHLVDGIIVMDFPTGIEKFLPAWDGKTPIVQCTNAYPELNYPFISVDHERAAFNATKYLLSIGRKAIALFNSNSDHLFAHKREAGWRRALEEAGLAPGANMVCHLDTDDFTIAYSVAEDFLRSTPELDTVFSISDVYAAAAVKAAFALGKRVPEDICVLGFDNTDLCLMVTPTITSIKQPGHLIGERAASMMFDIIEGKPIVNSGVLLPTEIILRQSTEPQQNF